MSRHTITVTRTVSAAHALRLPDGTMEPLHGHNWQIEVTVGAAALDASGWVMDFHALERAVDEVLGPAQNANLNELEPFASRRNPTAEEVAVWVTEEVTPSLPAGAAIEEVAVGEAPGCTARYRPA